MQMSGSIVHRRCLGAHYIKTGRLLRFWNQIKTFHFSFSRLIFGASKFRDHAIYHSLFSSTKHQTLLFQKYFSLIPSSKFEVVSAPASLIIGANLSDPMSDYRSFSSNYPPSSQSRKISIGIMVDSLAKEKLGDTKEDKAAVPNAERESFKVRNSIEGKNNGEGVTAVTTAKKTEATQQVSSPWISTKSFHKETLASEDVLHVMQTSIPDTRGRKNKLNGIKDAQETYSAQFFANQTSTVQSSDNKLKKFDGMTYRRKGKQGGSSERMEEFTFATAQENLASETVVIEDKTEDRTETLKMKLWEILGTVSLPKSQYSNSQAREASVGDKSRPEQSVGQKLNTDVKRKQSSDTIETDSEIPDHNIKRPITRSLARKGAPTKGQPNQSKASASSISKQQHQQKNIFTFAEVWSGKVDGAVNRDSSMSFRERSRRKNSSIQPSKIFFTKKDDANGIQQATFRSGTPPPAEKTSSLGNKIRDHFGCPSANKREYVESKSKIEEGFHQSPVKKTDQQGDFCSLVLPDNRDQLEGIGNPSFENLLDPQDGFRSPTFRIYANIRSFRSLKTSNSDFCGSQTRTELSDDAKELKDSPPRKSAPVKDREDKDRLSESSIEEDSESLEEASPIITGCRERETSPEIATTEKPKFMLSTKRLRNHEDIGFNKFTTMPSAKAIGQSEWIDEPSEQDQMDDLTRVVKLFALALENFKNKMTLATRKKSSEILVSASEGIHLQLQNVQSQIQTDVEKLASLHKSKRNKLESRFEEQQEQLKLLHGRFKEDLQKHLQNFRSTLEGLGENHRELKGTVKKQKASYHKLLLQVEESVESQLNDIHERIITIHKLAREKMLQVKHLVAECLKEGILN
ncbi:hypothetical protein CFOL_v3_25619 [Cephalotus follicularis]|uniref:Meiosis-specific protein ASY3-like coiled-coil domain-containing protein n=1 Tax=Cephalotus follicularis TaxID=3775 RepID=A0A1Q3CPI0_CEPFO|nr:hypothetical protein CFOL_v3_25619 [Cephalotus follicularis]